MAEPAWQATTPLGKALAAGRRGAKDGAAGVHVVEFSDFELVQVMARRGQRQATAAAAEKTLGAAPPTKPEILRAREIALIWSGPDQFFVLGQRRAERSLLDTARQAFATIASVSDQSDGRALLRLSGSKARDTLAKCCSLDLHPQAFPAGTAAATSIDHTSVSLWRGEDDGEVFFLLLFASFAESLLRTILDAAAEYGVETSVSEAWQP